jgi:hypothetical protein
MRYFIKTVAVLVLLGGRAGVAQTMETSRSSVGYSAAQAPTRLTQDTRSQDTRLQDVRLMGAPVGHRQPQARDVPSQNPHDLERLTDEDAAVDRKLTICHGC